MSFSVLYTDPKIKKGEEEKKKIIELLKKEYGVKESLSPFGCYSLDGIYEGRYEGQKVTIEISEDFYPEHIAKFTETVITSPYNQLENKVHCVRVIKG